MHDTSEASTEYTWADEVCRLWQLRNPLQVAGRGIFLILFGYLPPFFIMGSFFLSDLERLEKTAHNGLFIGGALLLAYLAGAVPLLFYGPYDTYRYKPTRHGIRIWTWRGIRHMRWDQVQAAKVTPFRGAYILSLRVSFFFRARIYITDYAQPRSLFDAIEYCLPIPIQHANVFRHNVYDP